MKIFIIVAITVFALFIYFEGKKTYYGLIKDYCKIGYNLHKLGKTETELQDWIDSISKK